MIWPFRRKSAETARPFEDIIADLDGKLVGVHQPLEVSAVLACVSLIADDVAMPELHVMRSDGSGRKAAATDQSVYRLLHRRPNEFQTSFEFRQMMTMHAVMNEEAVALITRDGRNAEIAELIPLLPQWVTKVQTGRYTVRYRIADEFGPLGEFQPDDLLIIRNLTWQKTQGLSAVKLARKAIELSATAEENQGRLQENGGRPSGILSTEASLSAEAVANIKDAFRAVTKGANRGGVALLDNGLKFSAMGMSSTDAQTTETRRFQIEDICRAFGVYPIMVGHSDKAATYASAEAFFAAHNRRTVKRWQRLWAERLDEFVLDGAGPLSIEFDNQEDLLAPLRDQGEFYARALGTGGSVPFMTVNEVRRRRNLPPIDGGDELREPAASTLAPAEGDSQNEV